MSAKKAKALRKEINYQPHDDDRAYVNVKLGRNAGHTLELNPACKRFLYKEMKKEAK